MNATNISQRAILDFMDQNPWTNQTGMRVGQVIDGSRIQRICMMPGR